MNNEVCKRRDELLGVDFNTNNGGKCFVIDYKGNKDVTVMFYNPMAVVKCRLDTLKKGVVKNPYVPTLFDSGYTGVGKYGYGGRAYHVWKGVIERSSSSTYKERFPSCKYVTVCDEWKDFQNFATWFYQQEFHKGKDEKGRSYQLDKDVLLKGNKVYSPDTCCFIPPELNILLANSCAARGSLPLGVRQHRSKKFYASLQKFGKTVCLGTFNTPEEAFQAYKCAKEAHIKSLAEKWKGKIDDKVYKALLEWKIEITD